jgi:Rrf2 family nitric oxide-sensitive transcriptional repressor
MSNLDIKVQIEYFRKQDSLISLSAEYSLRAVVCLANHPGQPLTIRQIADLTRAPAGYLAKILTLLSRAGMVAAQRGLNGGFSLVRDPKRTTLLDVVQIADPSRRIATCPLGIESHCGGNLCALHRRLDDAAAAAEAALSTSTIADIVADRSGSRPLCSEHDLLITLTARDMTCSK